MLQQVALTHIPYDKAVIEGKAIVDDLQCKQWRLGELADRIEPKYGEGTLAKFADEIGVRYNTLQLARTVVRAWPQISLRGLMSYAAAKALMIHPEREQIVREHKYLTVSQAQQYVREYKERLELPDEQGSDNQPTDDPLETKWLDNFAQMTKYSEELISGWSSLSFPEDEKEYVISLVEKAAREWTSIADEIRRSI